VKNMILAKGDCRSIIHHNFYPHHLLKQSCHPDRLIGCH
jgi:hypothetical protein